MRWLGHRLRFTDRHYAYLFLAPAICSLVILTIYPLVFSVDLSLYSWDLLGPRELAPFVGLGNYLDILHNKEFWHALYVTFIYMISSVSLEMVLGCLLAFLLFQNLIGRNLIRTAIISAMVMTPVVVGTAWRLMYNPGWGIINYILDLIGIGGRAWLGEPYTVLPALVVVDVWQWTPLVMIILLAGLESLPSEPFDAAKVDGASGWQAFRYVTLPLLRPLILIALLIRVMDSYRTFDTIFAMTGGGPGIESQNVNILMYYNGFEFFHMSYTAALAIISLFIITVLCLSLVKAFGKEVWGTWM